MAPRLAVLTLLALTPACTEPAEQHDTDGAPRTHLRPRTADSAGAPFSAGVLAGNTLYLSGVLGLDSTGAIPSDTAAEARYALERMRGVLAEAGLTMDDLVSVQVFSPDLSTYDTFNGVYREFFRGPFPARAFIGSGPLLLGARFEVQGIAVRR
jgi:enamine deaminase RidA (YjgF/YER057c/UK114 family)